MSEWNEPAAKDGDLYYVRTSKHETVAMLFCGGWWTPCSEHPVPRTVKLEFGPRVPSAAALDAARSALESAMGAIWASIGAGGGASSWDDTMLGKAYNRAEAALAMLEKGTE